MSNGCGTFDLLRVCSAIAFGCEVFDCICPELECKWLEPFLWYPPSLERVSLLVMEPKIEGSAVLRSGRIAGSEGPMMAMLPSAMDQIMGGATRSGGGLAGWIMAVGLGERTWEVLYGALVDGCESGGGDKAANCTCGHKTGDRKDDE